MQKGETVYRSSKKTDDDGEFIIAPGGRHTSEFDFWAHFLGLVSPKAQSEFIRRVNINTGGKINWDFWTGKSTYASALKQAMETINEVNWAKYSNRELHILQDFAERVVALRKSQLNANNKKHVNIYEKWVQIQESIQNMRVALSSPLNTSGIVGYFFSLFKYVAVLGGLGYSFWIVALNASSIYK